MGNVNDDGSLAEGQEVEGGEAAVEGEVAEGTAEGEEVVEGGAEATAEVGTGESEATAGDQA